MLKLTVKSWLNFKSYKFVLGIDHISHDIKKWMTKMLEIVDVWSSKYSLNIIYLHSEENCF
jgi:hypothetical protein